MNTWSLIVLVFMFPRRRKVCPCLSLPPATLYDPSRRPLRGPSTSLVPLQTVTTLFYGLRRYRNFTPQNNNKNKKTQFNLRRFNISPCKLKIFLYVVGRPRSHCRPEHPLFATILRTSPSSREDSTGNMSGNLDLFVVPSTLYSHQHFACLLLPERIPREACRET